MTRRDDSRIACSKGWHRLCDEPACPCDCHAGQVLVIPDQRPRYARLAAAIAEASGLPEWIEEAEEVKEWLHD